MRWTTWAALAGAALAVACSSTIDGTGANPRDAGPDVSLTDAGGPFDGSTDSSGGDAGVANDAAPSLDGAVDAALACTWMQGATGATPSTDCFAFYSTPEPDSGLPSSCGETCVNQYMYACQPNQVPADAGRCGYAAQSLSLDGGAYSVSCCEKPICTRFNGGDYECFNATGHGTARTCDAFADLHTLPASCSAYMGTLGLMYCCDS